MPAQFPIIFGVIALLLTAGFVIAGSRKRSLGAGQGDFGGGS